MYKIYAKNGRFAKADTSPHSFQKALRLYLFKDPKFKKWLMRIHVTFILLIAAFLQISLASNAQNISLAKKNISLTELFKEIKKQSGYDFVYTHDLLGKGNTIDIDV